jgi:alpha-N-arabinofuranosidase
VERVSAEGPHLYKKNGYYYLIIAEGGTGVTRSVTVFRSKNVFGPYESNPKNPIITHRHLGNNFPIACIGHADLVETQNGEWWAVLLGVRPYGNFDYNLGRETFLTPVTWEENWPVVNAGYGQVTFTGKAPQLKEYLFKPSPTLVEFDSKLLALSGISSVLREKIFGHSTRERVGFV